MADLIYSKQVDVPPQTQIAVPFVQNVSFPPGFVSEIELVIPDGHAGVTGIALAQAHQQVIPVDSGSWFISNDEVLRFAYSDGDGTGNWQAIAYNLDFVNTHTFYIRFFVLLDNPHRSTPVSTEIPISDLLEAGAASASGAELGPIGSDSLDTGVPTIGDTGSEFGFTESADLQQAGAELEADTGITDTVAQGGQGDTPDMSLIQFGVAPPDFGSGSA